MQPWILQRIFNNLRDKLQILVDAMHKYCTYLKDKSLKMTEHHQSLLSSQSTSNASLVFLNASPGPPLPEYVAIEEHLRPLPLYTPVCTMNYAPEEKYARRKWLNQLAFPFPVHMPMVIPWEQLLSYLWKIPSDGPTDEGAMSKVFAELTLQQSK